MMGHYDFQMNNFPARTNYLPAQGLGQAQHRLMNFKSCDFFPVGEFTNSIMAIVCQVSNNYEDLTIEILVPVHAASQSSHVQCNEAWSSDASPLIIAKFIKM